MASDPYRYFRIEARELLEGLGQGVLGLEKAPANKDLVGRLLRQAHTLKGAARVVKEKEISELAHAIEEILLRYREHEEAPPHGEINALLRLLDRMAARLQDLEPASCEPVAVPSDALFETVRLEIGAMDSLLYSIAEAQVQLEALRQEAAAIERGWHSVSALLEQLASPRPGNQNGGTRSSVRSRALAEEIRATLDRARRGMTERLEQVRRGLAGLYDQANELRLLPASAVFAPLERVARDAAEGLGRQVTFEVSGGEHRLDAHVLKGLREALIHVVRNAVAHGIEPPAERRAGEKTGAGRIELRVERRGSRVHFICRDDGRGIDLAAIRQVAVQRRLVAPAEAAALDLKEAIRLLLRGGVSTTPTVTELAGRGIGLEVVRETVARLKGEVEILSEPKRGTTVAIRVPVSLEALLVLFVQAAGQVMAMPFDSVRHTLRIAEMPPAAGATVPYRDQVLPLASLARLWGRAEPRGPKPQPWTAVVVEWGGRWAALGVDRLLGLATVVARPLPPFGGTSRLVSGASLDGEGNPQPILDPAGLIEAVQSGSGPAKEAALSPPRPPLLVVDDSLTTRMLEQSILETAGFEVDLAVSGEEALRKAKERRYALFVADIEMPGMDGFTFIERTQADPSLRETPAILVTSRASPEDRRRGVAVGAKAYILKSEFEQGQFLNTIRSLIGGDGG